MSRRPALKKLHHTCLLLRVLCALTSAISVLVLCFSNRFIPKQFRTLSCPECMRRVRSQSISFVFIPLRTLLRNRAFTNPFPSITCALFLMQWRVGGLRRLFTPNFGPGSAVPPANLPLYFQPLPGCSTRNPLVFMLLHCCPGVVWVPPPLQTGRIPDTQLIPSPVNPVIIRFHSLWDCC